MSEPMKVGRYSQTPVPENRPALHPVQRKELPRWAASQLCDAVVMRAYEVYAYVHGPQDAMITGHCRGGFSVGEILAFLYARSFPKEEWGARVDEALNGKVNLP